MEYNPYNLKLLEEKPNGYLDKDGFLNFLMKKNISVRKDNLPKFSFNHNIQMCKFKREGSGGMVPTAYKIPTLAKIEEIKRVMFLSNNNSLGKKNIENKEKKILEIFDKAQDQAESRTSIAEKVAESLDVSCNRKLVRKVLDEQRSTELKKLKKIS